VRESTDGACSDNHGSIDWGREPLFDADSRISEDGHEEIVAEHFHEQAVLWRKVTLFSLFVPVCPSCGSQPFESCLHEMKSFLRSINGLGEGPEYDDVEAEQSNSPLIYHVMAVGLSFFVAFFAIMLTFRMEDHIT
jgi:hypothetical protein